MLVIREVGRKGKGLKRYFKMKCDCGSVLEVSMHSLRDGSSKSCGCLQRDTATKLVDGKRSSDHPLYKTWIGMRERCFSEKCKDYPHYGGRGISICSRWTKSFQHFAEDMGSRPDGYSLDRIDNDGDYSPENCRWASRVSQQRNRWDNRYLTAFGKTLLLIEWAEKYGISDGTIYSRLSLGWSAEDAVSLPVNALHRYSDRHSAADIAEQMAGEK